MGSDRPLNLGIIWKFIAVLIALNSIGIQSKCHAETFRDTDLVFDDVLNELDKYNKTSHTAETITNSKNNIFTTQDGKTEFGNSNVNVENDFDKNDYESDNEIIDDINDDDSNNNEYALDNNETEELPSSWLIRGVNRVKREISRMLGNESTEENKEHTIKTNTKKTRKTKYNNKNRHNKKYNKTILDKKRATKHNIDKIALKKTEQNNRPAKRDIWDFLGGGGDDLSEAEGSGGDIDDTENDPLNVNYYRVMFISREPWSEGFRERASADFHRLHNDVKTGFEKLFSDHFPELFDYGYELEATLVDVAQTNDQFQIHLTVDLKVKGDVNQQELEDLIEEKISSLSLGDLLVLRDGNYSFTKISDHEYGDEGSISHHLYNVETTSGHGHGIDGGGGYVDGTNSNGGFIESSNLGESGDCQHSQFQCKSDGTCIPEDEVCDSYRDCEDGSDEMNCGEPSHTPTDNNSWDLINTGTGGYSETGSGDTELDTPPIDRIPDGRCDEIYNCKLSGARICAIQLCDGNRDCPDGEDEDEENCSDGGCRDNEFRCHSGKCIPAERKCDGHGDCDDYSDEDFCEKRECHEDEFTCSSDGKCIDLYRKCDGYPDCSDESDESDCPVECLSHEFSCDRGSKCISLSEKCDGKYDCDDGTDESDCRTEVVECQPDEFKCDNGNCIYGLRKCDGYDDCNDNSDERDCRTECRSDQYQCRSGECIERNQICDSRYDCRDRDDEENCRPTITPEDCSSQEFYCDGYCLPSNIRCDGITQCMDKSDEVNCHTNVTTPYPPDIPTRYPCPELTCATNGKCYRHSEKCDGTNDCDDGSDERNCCQPDQFTCSNGACARQCDGRPECSDGADEEGCQTLYRCQPYQWRCDNGQCISAEAKCDGRYDCDDYSDERNCFEYPQTTQEPTTTEDPFKCTINTFRCYSGHCIRSELRCNGINDCPYDSSDEFNCDATNEIPRPTPSDPQLNLKTYPSNQIIKESREVVFRCRDEGPNRAKVKWSRPGGRPLPAGFTDKNGRLEIPNIRVEDSGEYICEAVGYPAFTRGQSVSVSLTVERYNPILDRPPSACGYHEATCMNGECIDKNRICDGIPHCSDGSDEHSCSHGRRCSPNQFRCKNSKCVDRIWRCDGENDCGDNSDEESCDPNPSDAPCRHDEFQCRSGHCIPKSFHCDGTNDCRDGTDEVGCVAPAVISPPPPRVDLVPGAALNLTCRATGVPVPLIIWRLNWGHVPDKCVSTSQNGLGHLYCANMQFEDSGAYSCEIINTKGGIFVTPDTIVTVLRDREDVCPATFFNSLAVRKDECIKCFCFGISNECKSADLYIYALPPPITSHKVVGVETTSAGFQVGEYEGHDLITTRHGVQFRVSNVPYSVRQIPYLELPSDYSGNQLKSYGGFIKYTLSYYGNGRPVNAPDVIVFGNGYTLAHRSLQPPINNGQTQYNIQLAEGQWEKPDGRLATRNEIMMVLADVERILIRLEYIDAIEREVELTHITIDSAGVDDRGLGSASLVEHCTCPTGYMGYSCERCAPGYVRIKSGPWLGRCVPHDIQKCSSGSYGDPSRGIPCRQCPCPLTNRENFFATGCSMGPDGEPICNCHIGYTGHRCQECAPGYEGNPMQPGGYCRPRPSTDCHPDGTQSVSSDGTCQCKSSVVGPKCDMCAPNSFHLNSYSYSGCIECFCMGVSKTCTSSSYFRDTIRSSLSNARGAHGFSLVNDYENEAPETFDIVETNDQLVFRGAYDTSDVLYWSLPPKFLGDKVTAYGGVLNYTVRYNPLPGGQRSRNVAADVVIKSKNDIVVLHYNKNEVSPSVAHTYIIPIVESSWQRNDGVIVNREHLLMALADIEAIYIKATYTTVTQEAALIHVSMDTAVRTNTGLARAVEVEQCVCPQGYTGLSCEDCAPGYKRSIEQGLYLGICEPCECNGHSNECDPETGACYNCRDNTMGPMCDQCMPGFEGNATFGTQADCRLSGSGDYSICDRCDQRGVVSCEGRYCKCKINVIGETCDQCRPGTFNLNQLNPEGCEECFCSGVTSFCTQANYMKDYIPVDFISNKPVITDADGLLVDEDNLSLDIGQNIYSYLTPSYTQKYWSLKGRILGDQIKSYGGNFEFKLEVDSNGQFEPGKDVIIRGNGVTIYWSRPPGGEDLKVFTIQLESNGQWYRQDAYHSPYPASKSDIMTVLADVDHILIRATPSIPTMRSSLGDVVLETAEPSGLGEKTLIEFCNCPEGYEGTSCENCAQLHYRNISQVDKGSFGSCLSCNNHCYIEQTDRCEMQQDGSVACHCRQGYSGSQCEYGGSKGDTVTVNVTSKPPCCNDYIVKWNRKPIINNTYYIYDRDRVMSGELIFAKNCSKLEDRPILPPTPRPQATIEVRIDSPTLSIIPVGGSLTLTCTAIMLANRAPVSVKWSRKDGVLPYDAEESNGILRLYNLQEYDSGIYVCQAYSGSDFAEDEVPINVGPVSPPSIERSPPVIQLRPSTIVDVQEYRSVEVTCEASGSPAPIIQWSKLGEPLPSHVYVDGDRLYISSVQKHDEGAYRCFAYNQYGSTEQTLQIYVRADRPVPPTQPPTPAEIVYVEPPSYSGHAGETIRLLCELRKTFIVEYEWHKDDRRLGWNQNININGNELIIRSALPQDSGNYVCKVIDQNTGEVFSSSSYVHVEETDFPYPPKPEDDEVYVKPLEAKYVVVQGQDLDITCEASGSRRPIIKWTRLHEQMDSSIQINGNILSIKNAQPHHRGLYICMAESSSGMTSEAHTIIDVEPRERPQIEIYPTEPQEVRIGDRAILDCRAVTGIPEPKIIWRRIDGRALPLPPRLKEEFQGRLLISDIIQEDGGTYECVAENVAGKATGSASIIIVQPPQIELVPNVTDLQLTEGEELKLICFAQGIPAPSISWVHSTGERMQPMPLPFATGQAEIYIPKITLNDEKLYVCQAENSAGTDTRYVNVRVERRRGDTGIYDVDTPTTSRYPYTYPTRPHFVPEITTQTHPVEIGEQTKLSCSTVDENNRQAPFDIYWTRVDGKPLPPNSMTQGNDLILYDINYDSVGVYRCNVIGSNGQVIHYFDANVIISGLPHITLSPEMPMTVRLGETVDVFCNVTGEQPIQVEWHAESRRPMPPSVLAQGPYLRFNSIKYSDAGRYYCSAANRLGNATKVAEVIVNRAETIHDRPPAYVKRHEIQEGQDVNLTCDLSDQPGLRYIWRKDGGTLPQSAYENNNVLFLRQVSMYDEGRYVCTVLSPENSVITETSVELIVKPTEPDNVHTLPILKLDQQEAFLRIGESTEVECQSFDKRYPDVIWERADGRPLPRNVRQIGNKLIAQNVDSNSAGTYVCKCNTDEGDLYTTSFELRIEAEEMRPRNRPRTEHVKVGTDASLSCNAERYPSTFRWSRSHGQMQPGKDIHSAELKLKNIQASDGGTYVCTVTHKGESVDQPIILVVTGAIPQFERAKRSYMAFPTLESPYMKFNFEVTFKPTQPNGLILYNGQKKRGGDYIALSLNDRYPEFRFDFGNKPTIIKAEKPISLNAWHTVKVSRIRRDGYLIVDDDHPIAFPPAQAQGLDLLEDLYIGGVSKWEDLPPNVSESNLGFNGCISQLVLQDRPIELLKEAKYSQAISSCQPCADKPCENNGICLESQTATGYMCICDEGFTGRTCAVHGDKCAPGICGSGRCQDTDFGVACFCPLNKTGDRCQYNEHLDGTILSFKDGSYAAYKTPRPSKLNIKFSMKPNSLEDSVILYVAESERANGDFFAVLLKDKHIELRINSGARVKPVVVRSQNEIELNKWTDVEVGRRVGEAILKVGNELEQAGKQSGPARSLFLKTHLFIGGYDKRILLNRDVDVHRGFEGCISNLEESSRKINLIADLLDAANIQNCGDNNDVMYQPPPELTSNVIDENEIINEDPCMRDPCENYGTCISFEDKTYKCNCPLGYSGKHCHEYVQLDTNCQFNGNGYLEINRTVFSENEEQLEAFIAIMFSTRSPNGLLVWWGQPKDEQYEGQDFIALAINDGILEYSFRLDGEENTVQNTHTRVDNGKRHIAIIKRYGNEVSLESDHVIEHGETKRPTSRQLMILKGNIFIGGAPDLTKFTGNRYTYPFEGCVRVIETDEGGPVHLGQNAVSALNVDVCPSDDFEDLEDQPPVV